MKKELIAYKNPKSPISEMFRTLRTNIQFMDRNKKMRSLLVTSTFPGEGKSWSVANLAVTFAQTGKKVVIIDADMRKGRQYSIFEVSPTPGLSNYLSQADIKEDGTSTENVMSYIQETDIENLYLISAGNVPPNPSELLVSAQMTVLLDELKDLFDLVIIDGTPCELVTDSVILSRIVDSTIIVTAHKKTKKDALDRVIKNIKNVGGTIAGVILNRMPTKSKKYGNTYYYYGSHDNKSKRNVNKRMNEFNHRVDKNILELEKRVNIDIKEDDELPRAFDTELNNNSAESSTKENKEDIDKENEILKQINDYIEQENKNSNN